ncbi:MAG TPA: hypothetical protein VEX86_06285 [Longimicrobium sp.]|nr:hypothetical protein [Longimicrobium sp.]
MVVLLAWLYVLSGVADTTVGFTVGVAFTGYAHIEYGQVVILAVIAAGALGGCIHVASSFSDYVGNAKYKASWEWWYLLRPFVGSALAMVFYFLIRGRMFSLDAGAPATAPNFYAAAGVAFLVGMFSKQASDKLDDLFDTLFKSDKDAQRADGLEEKAPVLNTVTPSEVPAGSPALAVVLAGSNLKDAKLKVNDADHAVTATADGELKFTFTAEELAQPGTIKLSAFNAAGASTTALDFTVTERRAAEGGSPDGRGTAPGSEAEIDPAEAIIDTSTVQIQPQQDATNGTVQDPAAPPATSDADTAPAAEGGSTPTGTLDADPTAAGGAGEQPDANAAATQELAGVGAATPTGDAAADGDAQPPAAGGQAPDSEETVRV